MRLTEIFKTTQGLAVMLGLVLSGPTWAAPDALAGKVKAQVCVSCHGAEGVSSMAGTPHLAAQPPLSVFYQLIQFRNQQRKSDAMQAIAANMSDQDMRDIAAWYASLPAPPAHSGSETALLERGQQIAQQQFCASCHGAKLEGQKHVPRLAGQASEYFTQQLKNFRSGERAGMDGTMASAARSLTDEEIQAMAIYSRSLP